MLALSNVSCSCGENPKHKMKGKLVLFLFILLEKIWQLLKGRRRCVPKTMPWFGSRVGLELYSACVQVQGTNPEVAGVAQEETCCRLGPYLASPGVGAGGWGQPPALWWTTAVWVPFGAHPCASLMPSALQQWRAQIHNWIFYHYALSNLL